MAETIFHLDATPEVYQAILDGRERCTVRARHRTPVTGENGAFVVQEVVNREPTGRYLKVENTAVRHCRAEDITPEEMEANGFPKVEDEQARLKEMGLMIHGAAKAAHQDAGKAWRTFNNWQRDAIELDGQDPYKVAFLAAMKFGGYGYDNLEWDSPMSVIPFEHPQEISADEAKQIMTAAKQAVGRVR